MKNYKTSRPLGPWLQLFLLLILLAGASAIGYLFRYLGFPETNIVIVYLLAVLIFSCFSSGYILGILASVLGTLAYNYFFTAPFFSLSVYDLSYLVTFAVMTAIALISSTLTARVRHNAAQARTRAMENEALYALTNHLTKAENKEAVAKIATEYISHSLSCDAVCLWNDSSAPDCTGGSPSAGSSGSAASHSEALSGHIPDPADGPQNSGDFCHWPITGQHGQLGAIRIPSAFAAAMDSSQKRLLHSMTECVALAMDRVQALLEQLQAHEETVAERYRANLLRSISHDLRTPLAGIIGTSEMIAQMLPPDSPCISMAEGIKKDADWLHSLVENILSLTRIQDGRLALRKQPELAEEIAEGALSHISQRYPDREIQLELPEEMLFIPVDAKLITQVIVNLLDNAVKHTPQGNEIRLSIEKNTKDNTAVFTVSDRGEGIDKEDIANIFQEFYTKRGNMPDAQRGIGLGLTICEAIVGAHKGTICASNRTDGPGACFTFTLPLTDKNDVEKSSDTLPCGPAKSEDMHNDYN